MAGRERERQAEEDRTIELTMSTIPEENKFEFTPIECPIMDQLKNDWPDTYALFEKWGFTTTMKFLDYTYDKDFEPHKKRDFAMCFFLSKVVRPTLRTERQRGFFDSVTFAYATSCIDMDEAPCNVLNMEFFDRLWVEGLVDEEGEMKKMKHDYLGQIPVDDQVRSMLILRYSEFIDLYSKEERQEFLFRIFKHICISGDYEKFEQQIYPYLHTSRILYKMVVSSSRDLNTGVISVDSHAYQVAAKMGEYQVFPPSPGYLQTFCFFIIDNKLKRLRVWFTFRP